jgi:uncharacterized integral membrane protein
MDFVNWFCIISFILVILYFIFGWDNEDYTFEDYLIIILCSPAIVGLCVLCMVLYYVTFVKDKFLKLNC